MKTPPIQPSPQQPPRRTRHAAPPASSPWGADGVDSQPLQPRVISAREAARLLLEGKGLDKANVPYRLREWASASDGSLYLLYSESPSQGRGYLARVEVEGRIAWELPLEEGSWRRLSATPDGGVRVGSPRAATAVSSAGAVLRTEQSPMDFETELTDRAGVRYELRVDRHLRGVDAAGAEVALPESVSRAFLEGGKPLADGGVLVRGGRKVFELDPGGSLRREHELPEWPRYGSTKCSVVDAWPVPGGGLMVQRRDSTEVPGEYVDYNPGGHMGPLMDPIPVTRNEMRLVRLDEGGRVLWESEPLGAMPNVAVLPDGTAFVDRPNSGSRKALLSRVRPQDGKLEKVFPFEGMARTFQAEPGGTLLVGRGGTYTRLDPRGKVLAELTLPEQHKGSALLGALPDGRLLFRDLEGRQARALRLETGEWTELTDPTGDHSLALRSPGPEEAARQVVDGEEWVVIGDVRLPRQKGS